MRNLIQNSLLYRKGWNLIHTLHLPNPETKLRSPIRLTNNSLRN